jgi:hypothetical protein
MLGSQLVNCLLDDFKSTLVTHALGRHIGVHTSSVPVSISNRLGVKSAEDLEVFAHTLKDVSGHHQLITGINSDARSNLVLLLSGHNFSINTRHGDSGVKACLVHGIGDGTSKVILGSSTAVVRSLGAAGHTALWPAKRSALIQVEEGEFLFQTEPNFFVISSDKELFSYKSNDEKIKCEKSF